MAKPCTTSLHQHFDEPMPTHQHHSACTATTPLGSMRLCVCPSGYSLRLRQWPVATREQPPCYSPNHDYYRPSSPKRPHPAHPSRQTTIKLIHVFISFGAFQFRIQTGDGRNFASRKHMPSEQACGNIATTSCKQIPTPSPQFQCWPAVPCKALAKFRCVKRPFCERTL